jgi:P-type Cu2+ transporter
MGRFGNVMLTSGYTMLEDLGWAAGVLAGVGLTLSPAIGAILVSLSTSVVALNAQTLRRVDLAPEPIPA